MDRLGMRVALLKAMLVALGVSSWIFVSFVFATRPEEQVVFEDPLTSLVRLPASLPGTLAQPAPKVVDKVQMQVVKLGCLDVANSAPRTTQARWVRLTGRPCEHTENEAQVRITNSSTGYTATLLSLGEDHLTTDFIPLQKGQNEIVVTITGTRGTRLENRLGFVRQ